jgi:hypothetical protein
MVSRECYLIPWTTKSKKYTVPVGAFSRVPVVKVLHLFVKKFEQTKFARALRLKAAFCEYLHVPITAGPSLGWLSVKIGKITSE